MVLCTPPGMQSQKLVLNAVGVAQEDLKKKKSFLQGNGFELFYCLVFRNISFPAQSTIIMLWLIKWYVLLCKVGERMVVKREVENTARTCKACMSSFLFLMV